MAYLGVACLEPQQKQSRSGRSGRGIQQDAELEKQCFQMVAKAGTVSQGFLQKNGFSDPDLHKKTASRENESYWSQLERDPTGQI